MPQLNLVLVEPRIPQNTGNIARTCAATGARLHLVGPMGFSLDSAKLKRAGLDYWEYLDITTKGRRVYSQERFPDRSWLVFGREDAGLPEELLLKHPQRCLRLPMRQGLRSLNLSNTVAVAAYEVLRQWSFPELENFGRLHQYQWPDTK